MHKEAKASYQAVLRVYPSNFTALHHLGVLALDQNEPDEAQRLYNAGARARRYILRSAQ